MNDTIHNGDSPVGGAIGSRIVSRVVQGVLSARAQSGDITTRVAQTTFREITNHVSDEVRGVTRGLWIPAADHPDTPEELRALFRSLGTQRGQAWAWLGGTAVGAALGGGLLNLLTNTMNPVILPIIASSPHGILPASEAAAADVRGLTRGWSPKFDANAGGIDDDRYNALREMARALPTVDELRVMLNRGDITVDTFAGVLRLYGYSDAWHSDIIALSQVDHTAAEIAAMWNRGIIDTQTATLLGRRVGMSETQIDRLLELGGEPPGPQELLEAWRKGIVTEAQVDRALKQSPLRFEWIPVIKALQWRLLPPSEAADAVNQGHLTPAEGQEHARLAGIKPEDFAIMIANAGIPPGPQETLDWVNRGLLTEDEGEQALYESRIKNKWVPTYMKSRHETMPPETIRLAYSRGAITREDGSRRLQMRGYSPADAEVILDMATMERDQATRELTAAQIRALYADRAITREAAAQMLSDLGYEPVNVEFLLAMSDVDRIQKFTNAIITRLRAGYVAYRLDDGDVTTALDSINYPPDGRDDLLALWDLERTVVTRGLTTAQVQQALRRGLIDIDGAMSRLLAQGYSEEDASILIALTAPAGG